MKNYIEVFKIDKEWEKFKKILLSWIGTPYRHMTGVKGRGADCNLFIGNCLIEAGYMKALNYDYYPKDWWIHSKRELILDYIEKHRKLLFPEYDLKRIYDLDNLQRGDYLGFSYGSKFGIVNHSGIYLGNNHFIHAHSKKGVCIEEMTNSWKNRLKIIFRLFKKVK